MSKRFYHYTSADGVLGILEIGKIRLQLFEANYMNDKTEGVEIYKQLEAACEQLEKQNEITSVQKVEIIQYAKNNACNYPVCFFTQDANDTDFAFKRCRVFVMSFSESSDSLPMWNYYGNYGYCLHFTENLIARLWNPTLFPYYHYFASDIVIYSDSQKIADLQSIVLKNKEKTDYREKICGEINSKRFFFKCKDFNYEKEYRILVAVPDEVAKSSIKQSCPEIKYKNKSGMIRPYIEIELPEDQRTSLLGGVTIGPLTDSQMARNGLSRLLIDRGYFCAAANLVPSQVPVRF